jgi:hypothetical protein
MLIRANLKIVEQNDLENQQVPNV